MGSSGSAASIFDDYDGSTAAGADPADTTIADETTYERHFDLLDPVVPQPVREPFQVPKDGVTRLLCATAHLNASFANYVNGELVEPKFTGMAPNWDIDTIALARHAAQARARRNERDLHLLYLFVVVVAALEIVFASFLTGHLSAGQFGLAVLVIALATYAGAALLVWVHYAAVHRSAIAVVGNTGVDAEEPSKLPAQVEQVLDDNMNANVILFSGSNPFKGSGDPLEHWTLSADLGTGRARPDGSRERPQEFDTVEIHEDLLRRLPSFMTPAPTKAGHRLYVIGGSARSVAGLFRSGPPDAEGVPTVRFRRPVSVVPESVIHDHLRHPQAAARPYTFFELTGWDGQVVVTLFVRAVVRHPVLFVEVAICALRPLRGELADVAQIPLGPSVGRLPVLRSVLPQALPLLFLAPGHAWKRSKGARADKAALEDLEVRLSTRVDIDYSAGSSLREEVAGSGIGDHFGHIDEEMFYRTFNRSILEALREFLREKNIDTADFERQQAVIVDKTAANAQSIYGDATG